MGAELQMGDPQGSVTEEAAAPQLIAPTTSQVLGASFAQQFSENPTVAGARAVPNFLGATHGTGQIDPATGDEVQAPDPLVPKDQLNKQYGIPGALTFDQDTSDAVAQELHDHHVAEIQRADILQRNAGSVATGGVARFLAGTAASLLDPLNIAATFVPGLPEARVAGMLGEAAEGAAGRAAVRAITGASQGIAGAAALQPLQYGLDKLQQDDWDMGTALSQVFYGGLLGGVMHAGLGAFTDRAALPEWAKPIADAPPSLQEDLTKGAISAVAEDRPMQNAQAIDIHDDLRAADGPVPFKAPDEASPTEAAVTQQLGGYADRLGVKLDPDEALTLARSITEAPAEQAEAISQDVLQRIQARVDPDATPPSQAPLAVAQSTADEMAANQARPVGDLAAEAQQREVTARAARAPDPTGDPAKDLAAVKQHSQDFNDYVQQQKQLGHWTEGDDNALSKIAEHEALAAGDAKAFATAAACLTSGVAANA